MIIDFYWVEEKSKQKQKKKKKDDNFIGVTDAHLIVDTDRKTYRYWENIAPYNIHGPGIRVKSILDLYNYVPLLASDNFSSMGWNRYIE